MIVIMNDMTLGILPTMSYLRCLQDGLPKPRPQSCDISAMKGHLGVTIPSSIVDTLLTRKFLDNYRHMFSGVHDPNS
jgi:hypothetical protein